MSTQQQGFSAIELLITLFIAALFLLAGNLIWSYTQRSGADAYQFSIASNIGYDYLRRYDATTACDTTPIDEPIDEATAGIPNAKITVTVTCPLSIGGGLVKIKSTVTYSANPTKTVTQVVYAN